MFLSAAAVIAASTAFKALFMKGVARVKAMHSTFAFPITSTGAAEELHIPGGMGELREWIGERELKPSIRWTETITNKDWEGTLVVPVNAYKDDTLGTYRMQAEMLGMAAESHPDKLLSDALKTGFTALAYDGVAFFSASHPLDAGAVQSNLETGALSATTFRSALAKIQSMTDYYSKPLGLASRGAKVYLMVGPSNRATAQSIVAVQTSSSGAGNPDYQAAEVVINEYLIGDYANYWFVMVGDGPAYPIILQVREKPQFQTITDADSESVFKRKEILHGVSGRWNVGYGFYQLAVGSTGA